MTVYTLRKLLENYGIEVNVHVKSTEDEQVDNVDIWSPEFFDREEVAQ